jgi:cation diffusion facilitator CzcD-associated flavoprotein CzcO
MKSPVSAASDNKKTKTKAKAKSKTKPDVEVTIIGSGFSGLCMGIKLKTAGIDNFVILEKSPAFGGTWQVNTYPGCACDVPSHLYSFSFAQNPDWSRTYANQPELWAYTQKVVADYQLLPHIRVNCALESADYDDALGFWRVRTTQSEFTTKSIICATGPLSVPKRPDIPGLATFTGRMFHTAQWDNSYDFTGKRVAVIGTGASAVQLIPEIAPKVAHLDIYQRTPPWILPRPDRLVFGVEKWLLRNVKPLQNLYRFLSYAQYEIRLLAFVTYPKLVELIRWEAVHNINKHIKDPVLRAKVTPNYTPGCKRVLVINTYYPALARPNVSLITDAVTEVRANSIIDKAGVERPIDALILSTGFDVEHSLGSIEVRGRNGKNLRQIAEGGLDAYKGVAIPGFPNFFTIVGPNTTLGHNSVIYMIESATTYLLQAIQLIREKNIHAMEVKAAVSHSYNETLQDRFKGTVWASGCTSWYLSGSGKNHVIWPDFTFRYRNLTSKFDAAAYEINLTPVAQ